MIKGSKKHHSKLQYGRKRYGLPEVTRRTGSTSTLMEVNLILIFPSDVNRNSFQAI